MVNSCLNSDIIRDREVILQLKYVYSTSIRSAKRHFSIKKNPPLCVWLMPHLVARATISGAIATVYIFARVGR